jgi:hypothetical protein
VTERPATARTGDTAGARGTIALRRDIASYRAAAEEQAGRVREEIEAALAVSRRTREEIEARIANQLHTPARVQKTPARAHKGHSRVHAKKK